jgi:DNA-binding XRE family transcriptional regulator
MLVANFNHYLQFTMSVYNLLKTMKNETAKRFEELLWHLRMSKSEFARKIGVTPQAISAIVRGDSKPSSELLQTIFVAFPNLNPTWLMTGNGPMLHVDGPADGYVHGLPNEDPIPEKKPVPQEMPQLNPFLEELRLMRQELGRALKVIESQQELLRKHSGSREHTMPLKKVA